MNKILLYANIALVLLAVSLSCWLGNVRKEKKRLANNQETLLSNVEYYKTKSDKNAASVQKLELTKSELEKHCKDLTQTVEELGIKVKRLQSIASTGLETEYKIVTQIKDSVVFRDSMIVLKCLDLHTPYLDVSGCIEKDSFIGNIHSRDTLEQIVHRVPKQFWFIKWGCKAVRQEVICRNPNSQITYSEYIELK